MKTILAYGEAGERIKSALGDAVRLFKLNNLSSAVNKAHLIAQPGDIVLLSPGRQVLTSSKTLRIEEIF